MADKTIGELPVIPSLNDDSLIPVEQNGAASHMTGLQIRQFAENVVQDKVAEAQGSNISAPATAEVGQLLSVKAVDENGKPTEWKVVDALMLPTVTEADNGKILRVVNGKWSIEEATS